MLKRPAGQIVTRFAPSPTGYLHIGGARTALFNWAFARRHGGVFILRIEDTDKARSTAASTRGIIEDLKWLGIDWDEGPLDATDSAGSLSAHTQGDFGPYFQSQRDVLYREYLDRLVKIGRAYRCFKTPAQLTAEKAAQKAAGKPEKYDTTEALTRSEADQKKLIAEGKTFVWRFRMPDTESTTVHDLVLGDVTIKAADLEDFVIVKADGGPVFHFANVVDDATMGVTHVLRAQEHLMNTPKHVAMFDALGIPRPQYAHMPLIFNIDGTKMSKRDKAKTALNEAKRSPNFSNQDFCKFVENSVLNRWSISLDAANSVFWRLDLLATESFLGTAGFSTNKDSVYTLPLSEAVVAVVNDYFAKKNQGVAITLFLAKYLKLSLPEIDVHDFRKSGYLQDVILNYVALLGWSPGGNLERFDLAWLKEHFALEGIGKSNAKFDREKLKAFNGDTLQKMSPAEFCERLRVHLSQYHAGRFAKLLSQPEFPLFAEAYRPRSRTLDDPAALGEFFVIADDAVAFDAKAVEKVLKKNEGAGLKALAELAAALEKVAEWTPVGIHAAIEEFSKATNRGMGDVAQPLRVALTGNTVSPAIHDTLAILGKASSLARISRCLQVCASI